MRNKSLCLNLMPFRPVLFFFFSEVKENPFLRTELELDFGLVNFGGPNFVNRRILLWSPRICPQTTVMMNNIADGMYAQLERFCKRTSYECASVLIRDSAGD